MELWTLMLWGLVLIPVIALLYVLRDIYDVVGDIALLEAWPTHHPVTLAYTQHVLYGQIARAVSLIVLSSIPLLEILDALDRRLIISLFYLVSLVLAGDAVRVRLARKRRMELQTQEQWDAEEETNGG